MISLLNILGLRTGRTVLRPPGAVPEDEFFRRCIQCNKCLLVCPYDSITSAGIVFGGKLGTPVISARDVPCYVCMKCPPVCPTGALDPSLSEKREVRMGTAEIDREVCLPYNGVICRACFERCPIYREAIILEEDMYPVVQPEYCIGCGICEHVCPVEGSAVHIESAHKV